MLSGLRISLVEPYKMESSRQVATRSHATIPEPVLPTHVSPVTVPQAQLRVLLVHAITEPATIVPVEMVHATMGTAETELPDVVAAAEMAVHANATTEPLVPALITAVTGSVETVHSAHIAETVAVADCLVVFAHSVERTAMAAMHAAAT